MTSTLFLFVIVVQGVIFYIMSWSCVCAPEAKSNTLRVSCPGLASRFASTFQKHSFRLRVSSMATNCFTGVFRITCCRKVGFRQRAFWSGFPDYPVWQDLSKREIVPDLHQFPESDEALWKPVNRLPTCKRLRIPIRRVVTAVKALCTTFRLGNIGHIKQKEHHFQVPQLSIEASCLFSIIFAISSEVESQCSGHTVYPFPRRHRWSSKKR